MTEPTLADLVAAGAAVRPVELLAGRFPMFTDADPTLPAAARHVPTGWALAAVDVTTCPARLVDERGDKRRSWRCSQDPAICAHDGRHRSRKGHRTWPYHPGEPVTVIEGQLSLTDAAADAEQPARRRHHTADPDTSRAAAKANRPQRQTLRAAVLEALRSTPAGLTDDDLAERLAHLTRHRHSVATRRGELVTAGLAHDTGRRRPNVDGHACVVWAATPPTATTQEPTS